MKRLLIFIFVLLIGSAYALSTDMKGTYEPRETAIVKISGLLEPIQNNQVEIKRNNVLVPVEYDAKKIANDYYLWFVSPDNENNYTLNLNNVLTLVNGIQSRIDYRQNFVVSGNLTNYYVKPGFGIVDGSIEIKVYSNLNNGIDISILGDNRKIVSGENVFFLNPSERGFIIGNVGKYNLPLYVLGGASNESIYYAPNLTKNIDLAIEPNDISAILIPSNLSRTFSFSIFNRGEQNLSKVYVSYNRSLIELNPEIKVDIGINETVSYNLTLRGSSNESFYSLISIGNGSFFYNLPIRINFTYNEKEVIVNYSYQNKSEADLSGMKCFEIGGGICGSGEQCSVADVQSLDGACCRALCKPVSSGGSWSFIGYFIVALVIVGGIVLWYKYHKVGSDKNIIRKKFAEAEERVNKGP